MRPYSDLCAEARRLFMVAHQGGLNNAEVFVRLWGEAVLVAQELAMGSSLRGLRFERVEFADDAWKVVVGAMKPLEALGCVEKRKDGHNVAYVLKPEKFDPRKVEAHFADRRRGPRRKAETPCALPPTPEKIIREVYVRPPRKVVEDTMLVLVDLANVTKAWRGGMPMLPANRINWSALRTALSTYHGKTVPLHGKIELCVSRHYHGEHRAELACAERFGFSVNDTFGEKEGDTVVICAMLDAVLKVMLGDVDRLPVITLVSGDKDFTGIIQVLRRHAKTLGLDLRLKVVSWESALSCHLEHSAYDFVALDSIVHRIRV